ncbi:glycosyl hydrolase family 85-domain-containing protein [Rhodocollybia butyracea]|uniref:Glycosyl hydrolase family 85-domain-containing protein n=1 Tax=Rhodocollybia butyracea TaxID=206335 RepID=A0A9P5PFV8_9AGAR|nr:glycosyl hydrolase family 85-domain-containing protein [Rhodocollybia butyracea]
MPLIGNANCYFKSLDELDKWVTKFPPSASAQEYNNILPLYPRSQANGSEQHGKLLLLSPSDNNPPPGWINASHRQGVKMLGTIIFEGDGQQDCLRLLVGKLPQSRTAPVSQPSTPTTLPISPHYARLFADLAKQRGFDGYLLNFECPLVGGIEQTRALAGWITLLREELKKKVGDFAEVVWYDSVVFTGQLAWQDRLNSLNLPFFLSSSSLFTNYTWRNNYPSLTAQYFLSLDASLTGNAESHPHIEVKKLHDIYVGVDVWGRGSHGNGGFGSFKAISHVAPSSLGLSVALFGQAWTWESEEDKPGFSWNSWWNYERKLWTGKSDDAEEIVVPPMPPLKQGELPCTHDIFTPLVSYFQSAPPPDPLLLPLHTTFSPGVGTRWFVKGVEMYHRLEGWTDVDKQTSLGDLVWPKPLVFWEGEAMNPKGLELPKTTSQICMDDAWNGGSSLRLVLKAAGTEAKNAAFRCVWMPVQSVAATAGRSYEATLVYKQDIQASGDMDLDVALSIKAKASSESQNAHKFQTTPLSTQDSANLGHGWMALKIRYTVPATVEPAQQLASVGLVITIIPKNPKQPFATSLLLGQLNIYSSQPPIFQHIRPIAAWPAQPSTDVWFPKLMYANIYALEYRADGTPDKAENAVWIGTSGYGYEGMRNTTLRVGSGKMRFYIQGVTDKGDVLDWERCVFVDV